MKMKKKIIAGCVVGAALAGCQWPSILTHIRPTILTHFEAETAAVWLYPLSFSQPYKPGGGNLEGVEHDTQNQSVT
ncbi:hypothetical protein [Desulfolithobacter dissulfuricans]|uniref:hypothetical protein n=1 Tax=Desulfolithobacter dissulfuricans TaxID=2795293 RepID=UPI002278A515|nr:hypothetical protein [Desulfolithobacter dissulfuricans]